MVKSSRRILLIALAVFTAGVLVGGAFWFGFRAGMNFPQVLTVRGVSNIEPDTAMAADFSVFWQAWQVLNDNYVKISKVNDQDKVYGAINGLVQSLGDPYTVFFSPKDSEKFTEDIKGNFGGIGAEIGIRNKQLVIIAPLKNSPAERAGLRAGDMILEINSTSTEGMTVGESVQAIRGDIGTTVALTIFRDSWDKPKEIKIVRANIEVPTLDFEMKKNKIAYIQLHSFNANSNNLFRDKMLEALRGGSQGLILDLRNDPGGFLQVAIDMAGWFFPRGTLVVSERSRDGSMKEFKAAGNGALKDFPVVVLVNEGSASASEILAGALHDQRKIKLIGEKTFGKGTVQQIESLKDGSSIKVTVANWVLPNGKILEGEGIAPDIEVKISDQDLEKKLDPQLDKAIEILSDEIINSGKAEIPGPSASN